MQFRSSGRIFPAVLGALFVSALPVAAATAMGSGSESGADRSARAGETAVVRAARGAPLIDFNPSHLTASKPLHPQEVLVPARPMAAEPPPPATPHAAAWVAQREPAPAPAAPSEPQAAAPEPPAAVAEPAAAPEPPIAPIASERLRQTGRAVLTMLGGFALLLVTAVFLRLSATRRAVPARA